MRESSKSKALWKPDSIEWRVLQGDGIDIGPSTDPVFPGVRTFDIEDGDANEISRYVLEQFDYVYASHCLEHMHHPRKALLEWWKLVRPGGHIFFTVPDEDLYEQGVFPSRFNPDHKNTFTISKTESWSPQSVNVLDLAQSLPNGTLVRLALQDHEYDRRLMTWGPRRKTNALIRTLFRAYRWVRTKSGWRSIWAEQSFAAYEAVDQTRMPHTLAQIQCIVQKDLHSST